MRDRCTWQASDAKRHIGLVGREGDDPNAPEVLWDPAPQEIEIINTSKDHLRYLARRTDTGKEIRLATELPPHSFKVLEQLFV
jgi:hypothetical protein